MRCALVLSGSTGGKLIGKINNASIAGLKLGVSRAFLAKLTIPATLAAGTYCIVATLDPENLLAETDSQRANNTQGLVTDIPIQAPFSDIRVENVTFTPSKPGRATAGVTTVTLKNYGNSTSTGTVEVD